MNEQQEKLLLMLRQMRKAKEHPKAEKYTRGRIVVELYNEGDENGYGYRSKIMGLDDMDNCTARYKRYENELKVKEESFQDRKFAPIKRSKLIKRLLKRSNY